MSGKGHLDIGELPVTSSRAHFLSGSGAGLAAVGWGAVSTGGSSSGLDDASSTSRSIWRNSFLRSSVARRNSARPLPRALASSGSFFGPRTIKASPRIRSNSGMPMPNMNLSYAISYVLARMAIALRAAAVDVSFDFMARTAVVVDRQYLKHDAGPSHPERPERIQVLLDLAD